MIIIIIIIIEEHYFPLWNVVIFNGDIVSILPYLVYTIGKRDSSSDILEDEATLRKKYGDKYPDLQIIKTNRGGKGNNNHNNNNNRRIRVFVVHLCPLSM